MYDLLALLLPYVAALASTVGAGVAASDVFALARARLVGAYLPIWAAWLLDSRIGARLTVMALSAVISVAVSALLAYATGQPIGGALDKALAAIVASQLYHLKDMRGQLAAHVATEVVGIVFTPDGDRE